MHVVANEIDVPKEVVVIKNVLILAFHLLLVLLVCTATGSPLEAQETAAADDVEAAVEQVARLEQLALSRLRNGSGIDDDTAKRFSEIVEAVEQLQQRQAGQGSAVSVDEVENLMDRIAEMRLEMRRSTGSRNSSSRNRREREADDNNARPAAPQPEDTATAVPAVPDQPIVIPAKTKLTIQLRSWLSSKEAEKGEIFYARVDEDVTDLQDRVLIPERTIFEGHVVEASGAGMFGSSGKLVLRLDKLMGPEGQSVPAAARVVGLSRGNDIAGRSRGEAGELAGDVAGEAVEGSLLGRGDPKKAAVGGGVDLALGKGSDVFLRSGTKLLVEMDEEVMVPWKWPESSSSRRRRRR